jgi:hypothetical protein
MKGEWAKTVEPEDQVDQSNAIPSISIDVNDQVQTPGK